MFKKSYQPQELASFHWVIRSVSERARHPTKTRGSTSPRFILLFIAYPLNTIQLLLKNYKLLHRTTSKMSLSNKLSITDVDLKGKRVLIRVSSSALLRSICGQ